MNSFSAEGEKLNGMARTFAASVWSGICRRGYSSTVADSVRKTKVEGQNFMTKCGVAPSTALTAGDVRQRCDSGITNEF
jgi:hypothetical protein